MSIVKITRAEAAANMLAFAQKGLLVQGAWHSAENGRELACLLGAIGPNIESPEDCPASVMPRWMAKLLVRLFDGVAAEKAAPLGILFAEALRVGNTDEGMLRRWLIRLVKLSFESAMPKIEPIPDYWVAVKTACDQAIAALRSANKEAARMPGGARGERTARLETCATRAAWLANRAEEGAWQAMRSADGGAARANARAASYVAKTAGAAMRAGAGAGAAVAWVADGAGAAAWSAYEAAWTRTEAVWSEAVETEAVEAATAVFESLFNRLIEEMEKPT